MIFKSMTLLDKIQLELGAQEPWPKDVKLFQPYEVEQILLPDNANCLAVQAYLKMCNLDFQVESRANAENMSPSGKVPFIKCGAFVISELEGIVQFVQSKGISLTEDLEPDQKSDMRAYMSLIHNVLQNAELYLCWCDKETYNEVTKPRNGSIYPWPLNYIQTWSKRSAVIRRLKVMGWYDKPLENVYEEVESCCQALTDRLEGKEYFFGNNPTELDALLYGHISSIVTTPIPAGHNKLARLINKYSTLLEHFKTIDKKIMAHETKPKIMIYKEEQPKCSIQFAGIINVCKTKTAFEVKKSKESIINQININDIIQVEDGVSDIYERTGSESTASSIFSDHAH